MTTEKALPVAEQSTFAKLAAEFLGTFLLVFGGAGTAVFAANFPSAEENSLGVGFVGVALAFGLTVVCGAYAFGHVSGAHFNPAVSFGAAVAGRLPWREFPGYVIVQLLGGAAGAAVIYAIAAGGSDGFLSGAVDGGFASNGFGELSPGGFSLVSVIVAEVVLTMIFLWVILSTTSPRAAVGFAPLAIGLTLTLIHLISIPISNTSVNPARSIATALFAGPDFLAQVWVFIAAPLVGALIAGISYRFLFEGTKRPV